MFVNAAPEDLHPQCTLALKSNLDFTMPTPPHVKRLHQAPLARRVQVLRFQFRVSALRFFYGLGFRGLELGLGVGSLGRRVLGFRVSGISRLVYVAWFDRVRV